MKIQLGIISSNHFVFRWCIFRDIFETVFSVLSADHARHNSFRQNVILKLFCMVVLYQLNSAAFCRITLCLSGVFAEICFKQCSLCSLLVLCHRAWHNSFRRNVILKIFCIAVLYQPNSASFCRITLCLSGVFAEICFKQCSLCSLLVLCHHAWHNSFRRNVILKFFCIAVLYQPNSAAFCRITLCLSYLCADNTVITCSVLVCCCKHVIFSPQRSQPRVLLKLDCLCLFQDLDLVLIVCLSLFSATKIYDRFLQTNLLKHVPYIFLMPLFKQVRGVVNSESRQRILSMSLPNMGFFGSEDESFDPDSDEEIPDFDQALDLFFEALGDDFRIDHPKVMSLAWIPGVSERALIFAGDTVTDFNPAPVSMDILRGTVQAYLGPDFDLDNPRVITPTEYPGLNADINDLVQLLRYPSFMIPRPVTHSRSPTPILIDFEPDLTPVLSDFTRNKTPFLSTLDGFQRNQTPVLSDLMRNKTPLLSMDNRLFPYQIQPGMYINMNNELQKIDLKRQVSADFAKELLEANSPVKLEPYDDLHERNCYNRNMSNRKKRKKTQEEKTYYQECTCRTIPDPLEHRSRFVRTKMLEEVPCSKKKVLEQASFRYPLYADITVSELPQCVSVADYKQLTVDK